MAVAIPKRREVAHDTSPAIIGDHAFVPRAEWWSLCKICGLAQAAHAETTIDSLEEMRREHEAKERKPQIAYYGDDNPEIFE